MFRNGKAHFTTGEIVALTEKAPVKIEHERRENVVIIPTYNEAINLKLLVPRILQKGPFDVLIVDDTSPDGTGEVAEELARRFPGQVDVIHRPGKLGLGTAYLAGFHYAMEAGYQHVFTMDADFSHDPNCLPNLRAALEDADVALGSRYVRGGGTLRWPLWRRLLSRGGSAYARLLLGLPIHDLTGGFKGFRRRVLETILPEMDAMRSNGYAFQIETTYLCSRHDFRIIEVPILFENRLVGKSKMNRGIIVEALRVVLSLRLSRGSARTPKKTVQREVHLPHGRVMAVVMALVGLIILGTVNAAPRWIPSQVGGVSLRPVVYSHRHPISPAASRPRPFSPDSQAIPHSNPASIQVQGENLTSNVPLSIVGSGFVPGEKLVVTVDNAGGQLLANLSPIIADRKGHISVVSQTILANLTPGLIYLRVQGETSHRWARTGFQLHRIPPTIQLDPYSVKPKQDVAFAGGGFMSGEVVNVYLGSPDGERWATVTANLGGNVAGRFPVPLMTEGNYTLYFVGSQSQTPVAISLNVQGFHPWVTLDNYAPTPHTRIGFIGQDFVSGEQVLVYLNQPGSENLRPDTHVPGKLIARVQADTNGRFAAPAAWEVPGPSGQYTLVFVGQQSGAIISAPFTVMA